MNRAAATTSTATAALGCKLLITDKKDNWTGSHAMKGADVYRSTEGKDAKDFRARAAGMTKRGDWRRIN